MASFAFLRLNRFILGWTLFVTFAGCYILWRSPAELVWDDAPNIAQNAYRHTDRQRYAFDNPHFRSRLWQDNFGCLGPDGYRPLNLLLRTLGTASLAYSHDLTGWVVANGVLFGLLACGLFHLSRRWTNTDTGSVFAVLLVMTSTPLLTASLVVFTGIQTLVPLIMVTILLCYFEVIEGRRRALNLVILGLLLLFGPWYREFIGLTALLLLFLEWQRGSRFGIINWLSLFGFLHALFPTAASRLIFPDLPLDPVYQLGALGDQMRQGVGAEVPLWTQALAVLRLLHWRVWIDIVSILPPSLYLLGGVGFLSCLLLRRRPPAGWGKMLFLTYFFLLTFLPFLKVFKLHVHLVYCLVPLSILLAICVEGLWGATRRPARVVLACLLTVVVADQFWNAYIVRFVTRRCQATMQQVAADLKRKIPRGSLLLCNAHHIADIQVFADGHFRFRFSVESAGQKDGIVSNPERLEETLAENSESDIYCLDVRIPDPKEQLGADRAHWIVRYGAVDLASQGSRKFSCSYWFVDPLRFLIPKKCVNWPFSPDLQFDYYLGPALDGSIGRNEVAASYHLYKVTGRKVRRFYPRPILLYDDYEGFNLVGFYGHVYGIPKWEGEFSIARIKAKRYSVSFQGDSLAQVKRLVRNRTIWYAEPRLIVDSCNGFNLVGYRDRVYAIPRSEGSFDIRRVRAKEYTKTFEGSTVRAVRSEVERYGQLD